MCALFQKEELICIIAPEMKVVAYKKNSHFFKAGLLLWTECLCFLKVHVLKPRSQSNCISKSTFEKTLVYNAESFIMKL